MTPHLRASIWTIGLLVLTSWMAGYWLRTPTGDRGFIARTPFPEYIGNQERHWDFLQEARAVLPDGARYTIRARTTDEEMELFMLAATVLDDCTGTPSSYFGRTVEDAESVPLILSFECQVVPPNSRVVMNLTNGCICRRME